MAACGSNHARLLRMKRRFDRTNVFVGRPIAPPAGDHSKKAEVACAVRFHREAGREHRGNFVSVIR